MDNIGKTCTVVALVFLTIAIGLLGCIVFDFQEAQKRNWKNQWSNNIIFTAAINDIHTGIGRTDYLSLETMIERRITKEDLCFTKDGGRTGELLK